MNTTTQLMRRHSSVRQFENKPIDGELLSEIVACGQAASSSSFIQAYSVIRVVDVDKRKLLAHAAGQQHYVEQAAEFMVICADLKRIAYCCEKVGTGQLEGWTEHFVAATIDTALMAQNMMLAAESTGLGGVFIGGIRNDPQTVSECLELPNQVYPTFGLCLGWPTKQNIAKPRLPVEAILHQDTYDVSNIADNVDHYDATMREYYANRKASSKVTDWSQQTAQAIQGKTRNHMLEFLRKKGFLQQ